MTGRRRFVSADPIGLAGGGNLYWYANNNPLVYADYDGMQANVFSGGGQDIYYPQGGWSSVNVPGATFEQRSVSGFAIVDEFTKPAQVAFAASVAAVGVGLAGYYAAPYVVAGGTKVVAAVAAAGTAGREAMYRLAASQPMAATLDKMILYYPQSPPARATVAEIVSQAQPYVQQFAMGVAPGPGGPFVDAREAVSWMTGWGVERLYEHAQHNVYATAPVASSGMNQYSTQTRDGTQRPSK